MKINVGTIIIALLIIGLPAWAVVKPIATGIPQRFDSEPTGILMSAPPPHTSGAKSVGTADLIGDVSGLSDCIWRTLGSPGGRNIGVDTDGNIVVLYSKVAVNGNNLFIPQYAYSTNGGATWTASNLFRDTLRRCYTSVAVDYNGNPHFLCQAAWQSPSAVYQGFECRYLMEQAGISGGLLSTFVTLNDTAMATGTTPYNPDIVIRGNYIFAAALDYSGLYTINATGGHISAISYDLGTTWVPTPTGFPMDTTNMFFNDDWIAANALYGGGIDGPCLTASDDGIHLFDLALGGGAVNPVTGDTLLELPFFSYSDDSGATWTFGGALNPADTTIPRNWVDSDKVAGGWWHIGSAVMDHNGIVHLLWSSYGSGKTVDNNGVPTTINHDPIVLSYNTTPYDYTTWTHEEVGCRAEYDTVLGVWTGYPGFSCIACDASNNIIFLFCDMYDMTGYTGLWAQVKDNSGNRHYPLLINATNGVNVGSWCETPEYIVGDTVHCIWGYDGGNFSGATALMHSKFSITELLAQPIIPGPGVAEDPKEALTTYGFKLKPCRPNPVQKAAVLSFNLPAAGRYSLKIYNVAGQLVRDLSGTGTVGPNHVTWNAKDNNGQSVATGIYLYNLSAFGNTATKKLVVVK